ncbi:MAG: polysaccharide deacetylase family protein [Anaerolineae bacterium]|nr:polysaccharide deacetylase family protein [Anaerolineae bacterium]
MTGTFILSLDTEIAWGTDTWKLPRYAHCFDNYRPIVRRLIDLLDAYEIPATWAVVGHLFLKPESRRSLIVASPDVSQVNWYHAPDVIAWIRAAKTHHEIGTHTFSHVYTDDPEITREVWEAELRDCVHIHREHGLKIRSLVYPRNQVKYLDSLPKFGIIAYRGREQNWYQGLPKRIHRPVHLLDRTIGIQPPTYDLKTLKVNDQLVNLPSSQFLMAYDGIRGRIPTTSRVRQARLGIEQAVKRGELYHLWFHPFNLGTSEAMFDALEQILRLVVARREKGGLQVMTMAGAAGEMLKYG